MVDWMSDPADIQRLIGDLLRLGTVETVDPVAARCTVRVGDIVSGSIRWIAGRAGSASIFSAPTKGEQVLLFCPEGDIEAAIALPGIYSAKNKPPIARKGLHAFTFEDGSALSYDAEAHHLELKLAGQATASIVAAGGLTIEGDVTIKGKAAVEGDVTATGKIDADGDVTGKGISLASHMHDKVMAGSAVSGKPLPL
jgi:phage baseplate assembly protein V